MRQIWISKAGPPEMLVLKEAPDRNPRAGEARIRVEASGVNFADVMGRMGLYPDLPRIPVVPGYEVAGRVDSVAGESLDGAALGALGLAVETGATGGLSGGGKSRALNRGSSK